jgi:hypothetical protein
VCRRRIGRALVRSLTPALCASLAQAQPARPVTGHYPPGQSGIRGAVTPEPGFTYTNFSRLFTNEEVFDAAGNVVDEFRYANISMFSWTTSRELFHMRYGALAGIPIATGNLRGAAGAVVSTHLAPGDVLLTPLSLYGKAQAFDYQVQLTVWTPSGRFSSASPANRGAGFWALVYSLGGVYYPGRNRDAWSLSAVARVEQNFEQRGSDITPGDDVVIDWGVGRIVRAGSHRIDAGISGFGAWQLALQSGGHPAATTVRYRYDGIGPEANMSLTDHAAMRVRIQREFGARNVVSGSNIWLIFNYAW